MISTLIYASSFFNFTFFIFAIGFVVALVIEQFVKPTGNGRDMTSIMYRMDGPPIHEQTLGSADAMLLRLLNGDEWVNGTKQPYDPRIHFVLIRDAYIDANPENNELKKWLDDQLDIFDKVYSGNRPGFIEGYKKLKQEIKPWGK